MVFDFDVIPRRCAGDGEERCWRIFCIWVMPASVYFSTFVPNRPCGVMGSPIHDMTARSFSSAVAGKQAVAIG